MGQADGKQVIDYADSLILSGFTFAVTVVVSVFGSRMMKLVPILIDVASGYTLAKALLSYNSEIEKNSTVDF